MGEFRLIGLKNEGENIRVIHGQDCSDILKRAHEMRKNPMPSIDGLGQYAGSISMAQYLELQRLGIIDDPVAFKKWFETFGKDFKVTEKKL